MSLSPEENEDEKPSDEEVEDIEFETPHPIVILAENSTADEL